MSTDSGLYGIRAPKTTHKEISSSTTLAFTSTLSSLLSSSSNSNSSSSRTNGRPRPSASKPNLFTTHNKNSNKRALRDLEPDDNISQVHSTSLDPTDSSTLHRSKRKMEEKARLYSAMKRGDYVGAADGGSLIDFDRKWAENQAQGGALNDLDTSSDSGNDSDVDATNHTYKQNEVVEYEDAHGRTRRGTRAEAERMERKKRNRLLGAEELDRMSARPAMPSDIIYGDTVQVAAFNPDSPIAEKMEDLAAKRDKSLTPPPETHYEADKEIRTKGVGFYSFSKDGVGRKGEMEALEAERRETERIRKEKEERKEKRKQEIEARRKEIGEKRAKKQADAFLEGLDAEVGAREV